MKCISLWQPYLSGVLHGDGWCSQLTIGLRTADLDFAQVFALALNTGFNLGIAPKCDERGYWLVRSSNKSGTFSALKNSLPSSDEQQCAWLRGFFDSEGNAQLWHMPHRSPNAYHRRVAMYSTEYRTLELAASYLIGLDIPQKIRSTKNSSSHKGNKPVFELRILRHVGFKAFAHMVGSSIQRKQVRLNKIVSTYQDQHTYQSRGGRRGAATRLARKAAGGVY